MAPTIELGGMVISAAQGINYCLENVNLQNSGPIHFAVENQALKLDEFHMLGTETDLSAKGGIQLSGNYALDLQSKGRFNLKLLHLFNPDLVANGPATFTVNITGTSVEIAGGKFCVQNPANAWA